MYKITATIGDIDYNKIIKDHLPALIDSLIEEDNDNIAVFALKILEGDTTTKIVDDILRRIDNEDKNRLVMCIVRFSEKDIIDFAEKFIREYLDKNATITRVLPDNIGSEIKISAFYDMSVKISLFEEGFRKTLFPKLISKFAINAIEKKKRLFEFLLRELNKMLKKQKIHITVKDIEIENSSEYASFCKKQKFELPDDLQKVILGAICESLKEHYKN